MPPNGVARDPFVKIREAELDVALVGMRSAYQGSSFRLAQRRGGGAFIQVQVGLIVRFRPAMVAVCIVRVSQRWHRLIRRLVHLYNPLAGYRFP